jgi:exonuclease III
LTGLSKNFDLKLTAITEGGADIIFLSDTRIVSSKGVSASQRVENCLRDRKGRKYVAHFNSSNNSRGVMILVNRDITQFEILSEYRDQLENFLLLECKINGDRYCMGAIYGPNNTSRSFFADLTRIISNVRDRGVNRIILGGDWNTTYDRRPIADNIDTFQMSGLPNPKNSEFLENMCNSLSLIDPYRALYPDNRDYTYSPFGSVRLNRSRLDFFIVSTEVMESVYNCSIGSAPKCKLFDHKNVILNLNFVKPKISKKTSINNCFLEHRCLLFAVTMAVRRTHLFSIDQSGPPPPGTLLDMRDFWAGEIARVNLCIQKIKRLVKKLEENATSDATELNSLLVAGLEQEIMGDIEEMYPLEELTALNKTCSSSDFFVALMEEVKIRAAKMQRTLARHKKIRIEQYQTKLDILKQDYLANGEQIRITEKELLTIHDNDLRDRILDIKIFECLNAEKATPLMVSLAKPRGGG